MTFYSVIKCPKCGNVQMITIKDISTATLHCVSCTSSSKIRKVKGEQLRLMGEFATPKEASVMCAKIKEKLAQNSRKEFGF